ncbi:MULTISPECIES: cytochrome c family protein [unclassified Ruegeria]|uniref:c-type cytochrome n=1 Tax=unclassified Ruegeria TaxID=2625375 RepID=UPI001ADA3A5F|nr:MULTISPECIES: cytochrome c family protein [unclassified Ruegeria]MBO9412593.1 c-type cytochrome [Ruegeria sp. R8_1]MBO9416169.1 c-type cytochrome [Ruegeria sp. R8_2]
MKLLLKAVTIASAIVATPALAEHWTLSPENSHLAYGTIKKDTVGEVNSFTNLSGHVGPDGKAEIEIDLSSVETNIDIRNERMIEHVFRKTGTAALKAEFDMAEVKALGVGETAVIDVEAVLTLVGTDVEFDAEMFVVRVSETSVMVSTNDMVFISTEDAGVNAGVDKLMELASLPGITRTVPVTARLFFNMDENKAEATPAAAATPVAVAAVEGDIKAGKKVYRKCKACHQIKEGKNGVGPSLYGIVGAQAAQAEGFKYSDALKASGLVWNPETLAAFLADPKGALPGNKMQFPGLKKEEDITNVIAYLQDEAQS